MSKATVLSLINTILLIGFILCAYSGVLDFTPVLPYQWHKLLHIVGAILFLGNVIIGPLWVSLAILSKEHNIIRFSFKMLVLTDIFITLPAMILIVINGLFMSSIYGDFSTNPAWLIHSIYSLFALWIFVIPILFIQDKMQKLIDINQSQTPLFKKLTVWWITIGAISFMPLITICYLMIMKTF